MNRSLEGQSEERKCAEHVVFGAFWVGDAFVEAEFVCCKFLEEGGAGLFARGYVKACFAGGFDACKGDVRCVGALLTRKAALFHGAEDVVGEGEESG